MNQSMSQSINLGVMEIFFGPPWGASERLKLAQFLGQNGFRYFLYGPKADKRLRREWRDTWPLDYIQNLTQMAQEYKKRGLQFGVVLSPYGLGTGLTDADKELLKERIKVLNLVGVDLIGLFFDDMPVQDQLASTQLEAVKVVRSHTQAKIFFCPTFYTYDPILEKIFGAKPTNYLEDLSKNLPESIEIFWTGPKVISEEISEAHLLEVQQLLKRKPALCDNFFANDGPRNCKFLKLKIPEGRPPVSIQQASYWFQNPMNQIELSKIALLAFKKAAADGEAPAEALENAIRALCTSKATAEFLIRKRSLFLNQGLDGISESEKQELLASLQGETDPVAGEIRDWLLGKYSVGSECLTD